MKRVMLFLMVSVIVKADLASFPICENLSAQSYPAIDGGLTAWVDERGGNKDIYAKVLPGGGESTICTELGVQSNVAVSGSVLVWQDARKQTTDEDIYGYDVNTGLPIEVCIDSAIQQYPDISGRIVVWQEDHSGQFDIYGINLDGGDKFMICDNAADQVYPALSGHYVVWQDYRNGGTSGYDIYCRDLNAPAGSEFLICGADGDQFYPDIDGDIIVWQDPRNTETDTDIYGYDLGGDGEFAVCLNAAKQSYPMVAGNWIVWRDRRAGTTNYDIYGYNLTLDTETPICTAAGNQDRPTVSGQYVVWQDAVGSGNIYGAAFPVEAQITLTSPNGGETLMAGTQQQVQWQSQGAVGMIKIELFDGAGWQTLADNAANSGSYALTVPAGINYQQCLFRVSDISAPAIADQSDSVFTVFQCSLTADLTGDCYVDLEDFAVLAGQWLQCGNSFDSQWCQSL